MIVVVTQFVYNIEILYIGVISIPDQNFGGAFIELSNIVLSVILAFRRRRSVGNLSESLSEGFRTSRNDSK
jgi:hypothetical protein